MIKGFRQIASLTVVSRILGLIRDMAFSRILGAGGLMDIWIIAFQIPNLSRRLFGEGAASASLIPVYREQLETDPESAKKFARTMVTPNTDTKLMVDLIAVMLPYMILICSVAILAGILNVHKQFAAPAFAPIILNLFIIASLLLTGWVFDVPGRIKVFVIAAAVLTAGIVQLVLQIVVLRKKNVFIKPAWQVKSDAFKKTILLMLPMIIGLTATQINTLADVWIAKFFSGSELKGEYFFMFGRQLKYPLWEGAVSHLYYSQRMYQFPLGVLGISLATAIFPVMSADAARKDYEALKRSISRALRAAIFISLPAIAGLFLVGRPLIAAVFQGVKFTSEDTVETANVLFFYAIGLSGFFAQQVLTRAFYSMQDSKFPTRSACIAVVVNVILNLTLIWKMGTAGLALSTAVCSYLQVAILMVTLLKRFDTLILTGFKNTLLKSIVATGCMWLIGWRAMILLNALGVSIKADIIRLAVVVPVCGTVYFLAAKALRMEMLSLFTGQKKVNTTA
jgi:putative peptidoglycan lipid II flippase